MHTRYLFSLFFLGLIVSCNKTEKERTLLSVISDRTQYSLSDWSGVSSDTMMVDLFYDANSGSSSVFMSQPRTIIEIDPNTYWVADVGQGAVYELNAKGQLKKKVLSRGEGPNEIIRPYGMAAQFRPKDSTIIILDGESQSLSYYDPNGVEIRRFTSPNVSPQLMIDHPMIVDSNSIYWQNSSNPDFTLSEWDSLGNFRKGVIPRVINMGSQPETLNNTVYRFTADQKDLIYSYQGLPLVFQNSQGSNTVINLDGSKSTEEHLLRYSELPENEFNGVRMLVKGIAALNSGSYVGYQNGLVFLPQDKSSSVINYDLIFDNESIIYHFLFQTKNNLFFVDGYNNRIYQKAVSNLN